MPIDLQCPGCGERLRVADESAGKNAKCPKCQAVFPVPAAGTSGASSSTSFGPEPRRAEPVATPAAPPGVSATGPMWRMKTPTGQSYGPVSRQELDSWVAEGRISADCQVLAEGSEQWQWARDVLPALAAGGGANPNGPPPSTGGVQQRHLGQSVFCPHCHVELQIEPRFAGDSVACTNCGGRVQPPLLQATSHPTYGHGRDISLNPGIKVCVLISGVWNILVGLFWISSLCGAVIGIPQIILAVFEIIYFAQADKMRLDKALRQGNLLGILEIISGLFNVVSLVCGILVLVFASSHKS